MIESLHPISPSACFFMNKDPECERDAEQNCEKRGCWITCNKRVTTSLRKDRLSSICVIASYSAHSTHALCQIIYEHRHSQDTRWSYYPTELSVRRSEIPIVQKHQSFSYALYDLKRWTRKIHDIHTYVGTCTYNVHFHTYIIWFDIYTQLQIT